MNGRFSPIPWMFAAALMGFAAPVRAADGAAVSRVLKPARTIAIQHDGRVKPLESFAREALLLIADAPRWKREDPLVTVLSIAANPSAAADKEWIALPFRPLRESLGFDAKRSHVSYSDLVGGRQLMRMLPQIVEKQRRREEMTIEENEALDLYRRFVAVNDLMRGNFPIVPPVPGDAEGLWQPPGGSTGYEPERQMLLRKGWEDLLQAVRSGDEERAGLSADRLGKELRELNPAVYPPPWRLRLEAAYHQVAPFVWARSLYGAAFLAFLVGLLRRQAAWEGVGRLFLKGAFGLHLLGIGTRVILAGRPPVSNFYETMLWLPFVAVALAFWFERLYRTGFFALSAAFLGALVLLLADRLPLDPSISPIIAVLRSNLWLTIHVLTIVASYGALTLATVLAHLVGILHLSTAGKGASHPALPGLGLALYRTLQVGVVLLAAGIMLGGVWGNASWGRYWGWDPKETWALITLLWFLAVLHGRFAGWLKPAGVAAATVAGFFLLLMTYYGVSFYMVGLHSYAGGHAKPVPPLLIAYAVAELAFIVWLIAGLLRPARR